MLSDATTPSGIATSRVKYMQADMENMEQAFVEGAVASVAAKKGVPCASLRSRFASEFKSPRRSPLGEIGLNERNRTPR